MFFDIEGYKADKEVVINDKLSYKIYRAKRYNLIAIKHFHFKEPIVFKMESFKELVDKVSSKW